jgi:hypothetical protein
VPGGWAGPVDVGAGGICGTVVTVDGCPDGSVDEGCVTGAAGGVSG